MAHFYTGQALYVRSARRTARTNVRAVLHPCVPNQGVSLAGSIGASKCFALWGLHLRPAPLCCAALAATASLQWLQVGVKYSCIPGWSILGRSILGRMKRTRGVVCPEPSANQPEIQIRTEKTVIACMGGCGLFLSEKMKGDPKYE